MTNHEISAVIGFIRMGANCCQILEIFWYLNKKDIDGILTKYANV